MAKALKAAKVHWVADPGPARPAKAKKRPELVVVAPADAAPSADGGARKLQRLVQAALRPKQAKAAGRNAKRRVEVMGDNGCVLAAYTLVLEADSLDAEFEEAALILAEGDLTAGETTHLRARCRP